MSAVVAHQIEQRDSRLVPNRREKLQSAVAPFFLVNTRLDQRLFEGDKKTI